MCDGSAAPPREVIVELRLPAQRLAGRDLAGLRLLGRPDRAGGLEHLLDSLGGDEQHAVVIGEHDVVGG